MLTVIAVFLVLVLAVLMGIVCFAAAMFHGATFFSAWVQGLLGVAIFATIGGANIYFARKEDKGEYR